MTVTTSGSSQKVVYMPIKALYDFECCRQLLGQPSNTVLWRKPPTPAPWILQMELHVKVVAKLDCSNPYIKGQILGEHNQVNTTKW